MIENNQNSSEINDESLDRSEIIKETTKNELLVSSNKKRKFKLRMISGFSIILILIAIVIVTSWILHSLGVKVHPGNDENGNPLPETTIKGLGIVDIFVEPFKGFINTANIIVFLFIIGGFINIVVVSKALEGGAAKIIKSLKGKEVFAIIPLMTFFSICGSVEGMCEESLGFYIICVPIMIMAGFDKITGFLIVFLGAGVGVLCATVDPFAVSTAVDSLNKGANDINLGNIFTEGTGLIWRLVSWLALTSFSITYVMIRAIKIKKNPQLSIVFNTMEADKQYFLSITQENIVLDWRKKTTIWVMMLSFLMMILYIIPWSQLGVHAFEDAGKFVNEKIFFITGIVPGLGSGDDNFPIIGAFFLIASIFLAIINGLGEEKYLSQLMEGAQGILSVSLIVALSAGLNQTLDDTNIKWLVVGGVGDALNGIHSEIIKIIIIFIVFIGISMLIPSTSGFARTVLPLMINALVDKDGNMNALAPNTILAFVMANGFVNLFTPLSGVIFGGIEIARIDYVDFWKVMWKILLSIFAICLVLLILGTVLTSSGIIPAQI